MSFGGLFQPGAGGGGVSTPQPVPVPQPKPSPAPSRPGTPERSGLNYHRVRQAAVALVSLPVSGLYLVKIRTRGGATPGSLSILYDGRSFAHFDAPTNGQGEHDVAWGPLGNNIPAAVFAANGGISSWEFLFANRPPTGAPGIDSYRAIRFARTDGGAVTAGITVTYDGVSAKPRGIRAYISASAGRFTFPAKGAFIPQVDCSSQAFVPDFIPASDYDLGNDLTLTGISDGAATIQAIVFY